MERPEKVSIPVLTYHSLDNSGSVVSTAPSLFKQQIRHLRDAGYRAISLCEMIESLAAKENFSAKTVVLTFDDGFQNFYTMAFPVLQQFDFKATVFLVTDHCGKFNDWPGNPPDLPRSKVLSWSEVEELHRYGIEFGAHTRTHPDLTKMSAAKIREETVGCKEAIENVLGTAVSTFAYPFGKYNSEVKRLAAESFNAACSTNLGKVGFESDFFSLDRLDTYYLSNLKIFSAIPSKSFDRYIQFRQAMRGLKSLVNRN